MKTHTIQKWFGVIVISTLGTVGFTEGPAVTAEVAPNTTAKMSVEGAAGAVSVDGKTYFMIAFKPELAFDPWGIGLDLRILWNDDGVRKEDWDEVRDMANFIRYIRYGKKGQPFYGRIGILDNTTLGNGLLVRRYANMLPAQFDKVMGLETMVDAGLIGVEGFTNDVSIARVFGGRAFIRPLNGSGIAVFDAVEIGVAGAKDRQTGGVEPEMTAYGVDIGIPLVKSDAFSARVYAEAGTIQNHGTGFSYPGLIGNVLMFNYKFEYRTYGPDFIPGVFDWNYESRRPIDWTLPQYASTNARKSGWLGELTWTWESLLSVGGYFEHETGGNPNVHAEATLLANFIPRVQSASISYDQKDVKILTVYDPNTWITAKAGIEMTPGAILFFTVRQSYDPVKAMLVRTTAMETRIKL